MPRGDGTGPMGIGSMTGRMEGDCIGNTSREFGNRGFGCGRGFSSGKGFTRMSTGIPGCKRGYAHTSPVSCRQGIDEEATLKNQEVILEKQLQMVRNRLKDFDEQK